MTGPYQRAIEHLASIYGVCSDQVYSGSFETVVAAFPAYIPTEIAADVMKQRRINANRSPLIIDPELFVDLARHDREKEQHGER
jgi:hypothetical protein